MLISRPLLEDFVLTFLCDGFLARNQEYFREIFILSHEFVWDFAQV